MTGPDPRSAPRLAIRSVEPARPWFRPGRPASLLVEIEVDRSVLVSARLELLDLDQVVGSVSHRLRLRPGRTRRRFRIMLPTVPRHGYGLRLTLERGGAALACGTCAVEALAGWWESPRHAVLTDFRASRWMAATVRRFAPWHVTVVQFYDWMYRHYRYASPHDGTFRDALGRRVSPAAVREGVRSCHQSGIAALAYGSVYGAEREYVDAHPDERVFDEAGVPLSLGDTFFLTDLRPRSPWRRRLLREYAGACRDFGFDGVHMDTYGQPHHAVTADGTRFRFEDLYPGLIEEAAGRLASRAGRRVLFNCVAGYPLDAVARSPAAALYLELWPPAVRYRDVVAWIEHARRVGANRAIVIAAYISALRDSWAVPDQRPGAEEAVILLSSVIAAGGGYHQILAEDGRALVEGYYPAALALSQSSARELRSAWRFGARYLHLLSEPQLSPAPCDGIELRDAQGRPIPVSPQPDAGHVWLRAARTPKGLRVLSLVDLRDQRDDRWDAVRQRPATVTGWRIRLPGFRPPLVAMSPWTAHGEPAQLRAGRATSEGLAWTLPRFRRWLLAVERTH